MRESEERYRSLLTASPDGIAITDLQSGVRTASRTLVAMFAGANAVDLAGHPIAKLAARVPGVIYEYRMYPDGRSNFPFASPP